MPIVVRLDRMMAERKVSNSALAERAGISSTQISKIKNGRVRALRFSTLEALCQVLKCRPRDIIDYVTSDDLLRERKLGEKPGCAGHLRATSKGEPEGPFRGAESASDDVRPRQEGAGEDEQTR